MTRLLAWLACRLSGHLPPEPVGEYGGRGAWPACLGWRCPRCGREWDAEG